MIVKDKQPDIAILRTLGARPRNVLAIFTTQGTVIGLAGTLAGAALGVLLAVNLSRWCTASSGSRRAFIDDASVYLMSDLPAYVEWRDVLQICGVAFALCCLSTLYPGLARGHAPISRPTRCGMTEAARTDPRRAKACRTNTPVRGEAASGASSARAALGAGPAAASWPASASRSSAPRAPARPRCCRSSAASTCRRRHRARSRDATSTRRRGGARRTAQPHARLRLPVPPPAAGVQRARERRDAVAGAAHAAAEARRRAAALLGRVGLGQRLTHRPARAFGR
jgi:hypothetical protein